MQLHAAISKAAGGRKSSARRNTLAKSLAIARKLFKLLSNPTPKFFFHPTLVCHEENQLSKFQQKNRKPSKLHTFEGPHSTHSRHLLHLCDVPWIKYVGAALELDRPYKAAKKKSKKYNGEAPESGKKSMGVLLAFQLQTNKNLHPPAKTTCLMNVSICRPNGGHNT